MSRYYILDGHIPRPCGTEEWARWFEAHLNDRHVAQDEVGAARVSTVFLGLNHQWGDGPPLIFETMIFGGPHDQYQVRSSTWAEAEAEHAKALAKAAP
jgi:hypothetical protein